MKPAGDPPLCDCHGEPKQWATAGYWRCRVKQRESNRIAKRKWRRRNPDKKAAENARRLRIGDTYLGMIGFTDSEVKEMISGSSD